MGRLTMSFSLIRTSFGVLRRDIELLAIPVIAFAVPVTVLVVLTRYSTDRIALTLFIIPVLVFIPMLANAAVIAATNIRLQGGDPTIGDGLRIALRHARPLAGWALYSVTIGAVVRGAGRLGGSIGGAAADIAWAAATFFVVPYIVIEGDTSAKARRRSLQLSSRRFGESLVGANTIGFAIVSLVLAMWIPLLAFEPISEVFAVRLGIAGTLVAIALGQVLAGVYQAAMFRYATTGETRFFNDEQLRGGLIARRRRT